MYFVVDEAYVHRKMRRLFCNDDWKPTPPWQNISSPYMKAQYNTSDAHQYMWDSVDTLGSGRLGTFNE
jgi:hypothetical protein